MYICIQAGSSSRQSLGLRTLSPASSAAVEAAATAAMAAAGASSPFSPSAMGHASTFTTEGQSFAPHTQRPQASVSRGSATMGSPRQGGRTWGVRSPRAGGTGPSRSMQMHQRPSLRGMASVPPTLPSTSAASNGGHLQQQAWARGSGGAGAGRPTRDGSHGGVLGHSMVTSRAPPSSQSQVLVAADLLCRVSALGADFYFVSCVTALRCCQGLRW